MAGQVIQAKLGLICLYCGKATTRGRKGEHVVPETIGGALTLNDVPDRPVCTRCNSGVLSELDRELCSRSYLSVVASREIGAHLWQAWDVDHKSNNLLLEARPSWAADDHLSSLVCFPQIIFERSGREFRGDSEEFEKFGEEEATKVLFQGARQCFQRYRAGEKRALHFERIRCGAVHDGYRLPARLFTRHSIFEIARNVRKQSFILRFVSDDDKRRALQSLANLTEGVSASRWEHTIGSRLPTLGVYFDIGSTLRGLMKMGLNLIAAHCPHTPVDHRSFSSVIRIIRDEAGQIPLPVMLQNGFVHAGDIQSIKAEGNAHSFRLVHLGGVWHVYFSFFGGRVGAYVRVPGPNLEAWRCADIVAPLRSKCWTVTKTSIVPSMRTPRVNWNDGTVVMPSVKLYNSKSSISIEVAKRNVRPK